MKSLFNLFTFFCIFVLIAMSALAQTLPPQIENADIPTIIEQVVSVINQREVLGTLGLAISGLIILVNIVRSTFLASFWEKKNNAIWKRLIVVLLGEAIGILMAVYGGTPITTALIGGLIIAGGAIAIYEVLKPVIALFKK